MHSSFVSRPTNYKSATVLHAQNPQKITNPRAAPLLHSAANTHTRPRKSPSSSRAHTSTQIPLCSSIINCDTPAKQPRQRVIKHHTRPHSCGDTPPSSSPRLTVWTHHPHHTQKEITCSSALLCLIFSRLTCRRPAPGRRTRRARGRHPPSARPPPIPTPCH